MTTPVLRIEAGALRVGSLAFLAKAGLEPLAVRLLLDDDATPDVDRATDGSSDSDPSRGA